VKLSILIFASLLEAQSQLPKDVIQLSQLKREVRKAVATLDNYTCVETIDREERKNARQRFQHLDTLNVEVAVVKDRELYSWPGAKEFEDRDVAEMVGAGLMSTGGFRSAIKSVFIDNVSTIKWHGEEEILGRRALRWDYVIPYNLSGWVVHVEGRSGLVSETGSFWADAETLELLGIETVAGDIPPDLLVASIKQTVDYSRMHVRERDPLLPQSVETSVTKLNGVESLNRIEFSHCREFSGAAELSFNKPASIENPASAVTEFQIPAGLEISVRMAQAIDSKTAAVGDSIRAIIDMPVRSHGTDLIPKGALLLGRIRRLERQLEPHPYYLVGLEFTDIEFAGHHARFTGQMFGAAAIPGLALGLSTNSMNRNTAGVAGHLLTTHTETEVPFKVPGVSTFFMEGRDFRIPEGLHMTWVTTKLGK
jgi:hypothetical protein